MRRQLRDFSQKIPMYLMLLITASPTSKRPRKLSFEIFWGVDLAKRNNLIKRIDTGIFGGCKCHPLKSKESKIAESPLWSNKSDTKVAPDPKIACEILQGSTADIPTKRPHPGEKGSQSFLEKHRWLPQRKKRRQQME